MRLNSLFLFHSSIMPLQIFEVFFYFLFNCGFVSKVINNKNDVIAWRLKALTFAFPTASFHSPQGGGREGNFIHPRLLIYRMDVFLSVVMLWFFSPRASSLLNSSSKQRRAANGSRLDELDAMSERIQHSEGNKSFID